MRNTRRGIIFSALLGLLSGALLLTQYGGRGEGANAAPTAAKSALVGVKSLRPPSPSSDADRVRAAILEAARCHGIESRAWEMQNVVWRESRFNSKATGTHGEMGMAQFMPTLWSHAVAQMGQPGLSPWIPEDAAMVMAWCWARGYRNHWRTRP